MRKFKLKTKKQHQQLIWLWWGLLALLLVLIIFAPVIFPESNTIDYARQLQKPSLQHWFGTDEFGRDLLSRVFNGMRTSLLYSLIIEAIALGIGLMVGLVSGYMGGRIDGFFSYIMNVFQAFPTTVAAIALIAVLGTSDLTLIVVLSVMGWVAYARIVRSETLIFKERDFVLGARASGANSVYILGKHICPNVLLPVLPLATLMIGHGIMAIASLSFLGFGVQPPNAEIGLMLKDSAMFINRAPWLLVGPGLVLAMVVALINALGDAIRDKLDPQQQMVEL
ncbi:ABC transporter permease [Acetobacterium wieringae]|uniref:ABC transporter permease n=1 Tax=Acetobacterium wieringae TaxID=52694 RepID=UPI0026EBC1F1|nr:ABC transporter permease [Acetobacterium wieringae]